MKQRIRWERSAHSTFDEETGTTAIVRREGAGWIWAVLDREGVQVAGRASPEDSGAPRSESAAKGQAGAAFRKAIAASRKAQP